MDNILVCVLSLAIPEKEHKVVNVELLIAITTEPTVETHPSDHEQEWLNSPDLSPRAMPYSNCCS